jgi:hypothetical protein
MEPFRTRVEPSQTPEIAPQATRTEPIPSDTLQGNEGKMGEELTVDEKTLDIWEGMHGRKFATEYFNLGNIDGEFNIKMDTSIIDKYIKGELENKQYEKNIENWKEVLSEIEKEIGSERMELFSRIKKIVGYIKIVNKYNEFKHKKELYKSFNDE